MYFVRGYAYKGTLDFAGTITVVEREKGYWEPIGWMTPKCAEKTYYFDCMEKIENHLKVSEPDFVALTGTFQKDRLKVQERLWRKKYKLVPIKEIHKHYNDCVLDAVYVKFESIA